MTIGGNRLSAVFIILPGQRSGYRVKPYFPLCRRAIFSLIVWSGSKINKNQRRAGANALIVAGTL